MRHIPKPKWEMQQDDALSAAVYRRLGSKSAYVLQRGFEPLQQEQMVLQYLATHKRIARRDVSELCKISPNQSRSLISKLLKSGIIVQHGHKRSSFYEIPASFW